jgi:type IV/VI secretion system ImpK/VasF family protein
MKLYDISKDLFNYLTAFRWKVAAGTRLMPEEVQNDLLNIFREQEMRVRRHPELKNKYEEVRYPLAVFADEVILYSQWEYAGEWENMLLEQRFFNSEVGGDRFFELCEDYRIDDPEVATIYYTCLNMGFKGRYDRESEELRRLRESLLEKFETDPEHRGGVIFPQAYAVSPAKKVKPLSRIFHWRHLLFGLLLVLFLGIVLDRLVIWEVISAPVSEAGRLADRVLNRSALQTPISASSPVIPPPIPMPPTPAPDKPDWAISRAVSPQAASADPGEPPPPETGSESEADDATPESAAPDTPGYTIQIAAYFSKDPAEALLNELKERGYDPYIATAPHSEGRTWYYVRLGHFERGSLDQARAAAAEFARKENMKVFVTNAIRYPERS